MWILTALTLTLRTYVSSDLMIRWLGAETATTRVPRRRSLEVFLEVSCEISGLVVNMPVN